MLRVTPRVIVGVHVFVIQFVPDIGIFFLGPFEFAETNPMFFHLGFCSKCCETINANTWFALSIFLTNEVSFFGRRFSGGLISTTLFEFRSRPSLFREFGFSWAPFMETIRVFPGRLSVVYALFLGRLDTRSAF